MGSSPGAETQRPRHPTRFDPQSSPKAATANRSAVPEHCEQICLLELNAVGLTSSPEPSRGLFLNRHASDSYVRNGAGKTIDAALPVQWEAASETRWSDAGQG